MLAPQAVAEKSNEIATIPDLLALLDLNGAVVSIDAMGCQKAIAQTIIAGGGEDVLALKDNHPTLCEEVRLWLDTEAASGRLVAQETLDKAHGRIEIRRAVLSDQIAWLTAKPDWAGLQAVGRVESTRIVGEHTTTEYRYFLCSFTDPERFAQTVRGHWGIENQQHWMLDVQFGEDACRSRTAHAAENLALVRRMALNLLRHNGPPRDSLRRRKRRAALNDDDRRRLLLGIPPAPAGGQCDCLGGVLRSHLNWNGVRLSFPTRLRLKNSTHIRGTCLDKDTRLLSEFHNLCVNAERVLRKPRWL